MIILVPAILATISGIIYVYLLLSAGEEIESTLRDSLIEDYDRRIQQNEIKIILSEEFLKKSHQEDNTFEKLKIKNMKSQEKEDRKILGALENGKIDITYINSMVGYRIMQLLNWNASYPVVLNLIRKCTKFMNRGEAVNFSYLTLSKLLGNAVFGIFVGLCASTIGFALGLGTRGLLIGFIFLMLILIFGYLPMDSIRSTLDKRNAEIEREFPQVMSKLTLLTEAGMEVNSAWELTSKDGKGTLYEEMALVSLRLANNEKPMEAYSSFIQRCSYAYTSKLATLIMQNLYKGNSEIARQFMQLNDECWNEYRNSAQRMGTALQAKLFIPTMLSFAALLIMLLMPIMTGLTASF